MPGAPEQHLRRSGLNGDEEPEVAWVTVEEAPTEVPADLQMVADAAESGNLEALEEAMSKELAPNSSKVVLVRKCSIRLLFPEPASTSGYMLPG